MALHIDEIRNKYSAGEYTYKVDIPAKVMFNHVFDDELSVRRNRELVQEHNDNIDQMQRTKNKKQAELDEQLTKDVVAYIMAYYDLPERQAKIVEGFAYKEHHSFMGDYFSYIDTYADFAFMLLPAEETAND